MKVPYKELGRVKFLPELRADREALEHNVQIMALWCRELGVELAPYGMDSRQALLHSEVFFVSPHYAEHH